MNDPGFWLSNILNTPQVRPSRKAAPRLMPFPSALSIRRLIVPSNWV